MKWFCCTQTWPHLLFLLVWLTPSSLKNGASAMSYNTIQCISKEREALLQFKQGIEYDDCGLLTSWDNQEDCCQWHGIRCDNRTGHVIGLHVCERTRSCPEPGVGGNISPSLLELKHLKYLDLSSNFFEDQPIPNFIGSLVNLEYLNLSFNNFQGEVPHQLANLASLNSLDLSSYLNGGLYVKRLGWLSHLTLLRYINLSGIDLSLATDWMHIIHNLSFLRVLHINRCGLSRPLMYMNISTSIRVFGLAGNYFNDSSIFQWVFNLTRNGAGLVYLDLHRNGIKGPIPEAISDLKHLVYLDLSLNNLQGIIPKGIGNLCSLQTLQLWGNSLTEDLSSITRSLSECACKSLLSLDLSENQLWGSISDTISTCSSLRELVLRVNKLNGTISESLGQLSMLERLDLSSNSLKGTLSEHHLSNLSRLRRLDLSDNKQLVVNISANWIPPFQLHEILMRSCRLGTYFPNWLLPQNNVSFLDISNTGISDTLPIYFWNSFSSDLEHLNMSHNNICGVLPNSTTTFNNNLIDSTIDFSSNRIEGAVPSFLGNFNNLILNNNKFSDSIELLCPNTTLLLSYLDLSNNLFSGQLPDCWKGFEQLSILRLANNRFTGKLPTSIGALNFVVELYMRNNSFMGEIPKSFENLTSLLLLDLAYNSLTGYVPHAIGNFKTLSILNLRSNKLNGTLPLSLCQLSYLQILDLSSNHISGTIPNCIYNLTAMLNTTDLLLGGMSAVAITYSYNDTAMVMWKRKEQNFRNALGLVKYIAMSDNQLHGQIPSEFSFLRGLASLDLARNNLTGVIPSKFGQLTSLQFLDLSSNHLSGQIPASLSNLTSLEILDLSNNFLSGRIPLGTQLRGFDPASYMGNPGLCGPPLPRCPGDEASINKPKGDDITQEAENESVDIPLGFYISTVLGFIVGFWGVCGSLVLKRSWRHAYFQFLSEMKDMLHVMVAVNIDRVWRKP